LHSGLLFELKEKIRRIGGCKGRSPRVDLTKRFSISRGWKKFLKIMKRLEERGENYEEDGRRFENHRVS
jgi:hypothetical protein